MGARYRLLIFFLMVAFILKAQEQIPFQSFTSAGSAEVSVNATQSLRSVFGQPFAAQGAPDGAQSGMLQAVRLIIPDIEAPVIQHTPSATGLTTGGSNTISAQITDNISVAQAAMYYRPIGSGNFQSTSLASASGDAFSADIQSAWFDAMGLEYYFTASDIAGNSARLPKDSSFFEYTNNDQARIPADLLAFGSATESYRVISVPYAFANNSVLSLFDELPTQSKTEYRIYTYNGNNQWLEYPDGFTTLDRGKGYWILIRNPVDLQLGTVMAPSNNQERPYQLQLNPGWNQIGNPYTLTISWEDIRAFVDNANIGGLKIYEAGFKNGDDLKPFQGGFVYLDGSSPVSVPITFKGQVSGGRKRHPFSNNPASSSWRLPLSLTQGSLSNDIAAIGMEPDALEGKDFYDDFNPPRFGDYLEINFQHPGRNGPDFSQDIEPTRRIQTWSFRVEESNTFTPVFMHWDKTALAKGGISFFLLDEQNVALVDMSLEDHLEIQQGHSHEFHIYMGTPVSDILTESIAMGNPYPNPFGNQVNVNLGLPYSGSVSIEVLDDMGQLVRKINTALPAGIHNIVWDGRDENGVSMAGGVYFMRAVIGNKLFERRIIKTN